MILFIFMYCFRVKKKRENTSTTVWFFTFSSLQNFKKSHFCIKFATANLIEPLPPAQLLCSKTPLFPYTSSFLTFQLSLHQSLKSINISCVFLWIILGCSSSLRAERFFWQNKNFTAQYNWVCVSLYHATSKWTRIHFLLIVVIAIWSVLWYIALIKIQGVFFSLQPSWTKLEMIWSVDFLVILVVSQSVFAFHTWLISHTSIPTDYSLLIWCSIKVIACSVTTKLSKYI